MMRLRPLTQADCVAIADLEKQLFDSQLDAPALAILLSKAAFHGTVLVDDAPMRHIAYILAYITTDSAEIISIGTHQDQQRRGYGRRILQNFIADVSGRNISEIDLEVAADNFPAIRLYQNCGFVDVGRRKNYYRRQDGLCDALMMKRTAGSAFP